MLRDGLSMILCIVPLLLAGCGRKVATESGSPLMQPGTTTPIFLYKFFKQSKARNGGYTIGFSFPSIIPVDEVTMTTNGVMIIPTAHERDELGGWYYYVSFDQPSVAGSIFIDNIGEVPWRTIEPPSWNKSRIDSMVVWKDDKGEWHCTAPDSSTGQI